MSSFDPKRVESRCAHFIGGVYRQDQAQLEVIRPSDGEHYADLPIANTTMVDEVVENSWHAFKTSDWASRPPRERARVMRRWADLIDADIATLAPLEAVGSTRPYSCLLYTSPSPRDATLSRMPSSA